MPQLRIFCYMPSPRVWKAKIAARLSGVDLEIRSAAPAKLKDWLWDFDARPLTEEDKDSDRYKLKGHTIPTSSISSTSIPTTPYTSETLLPYTTELSTQTTTQEIYNRASQAFSIYMSAIERALASNGSFLVGDKLTLADICFACEYAMFARERRCSEALNTIGAKPISSGISKRFPRAIEHFKTLCRHEAFSPELGTIVSE